MELIKEIAITVAIILAIVSAVIKSFFEVLSGKKASDEVREAEQQAFIEKPAEREQRIKALTESQEGEGGLGTHMNEIADLLLEESRAAISVERLFNLYSKQIQKYQQETRSRATWSFIFAIFAMLAGFGFVIWGGSVLLTAKDKIVLAAGGILSTVGGAVSGYIAKTFLDVHRLSLTQLNRYFQQPVLNDHILMAQRLADGSDDMETRKKAYEKIIESITRLIDNMKTEAESTS